MSSMASNLQKILRQHIPKIQFRYGANRSGTATHASAEKKSNASAVKTVGATSQTKAASQSVSVDFSQIPAKYRRRQLTQAEIDLVATGGSV